MKVKHLLITIIVALIGASFGLFFTYFEYHTESRDTGFRPRAINNPYLAAQKYLKKFGVQITSFDRHQPFKQLETFDSIYVSDSSHINTDQRILEFVDWIKNGGHLLVSVQGSRFNSDDIFLKHFGMEIEKSDCDCTPQNLFENYVEESINEEGEKDLSEVLAELNEKIDEEEFDTYSNNQNTQEDVPFDQLTRLSFNGIDEELIINFDSRYSLNHPALFANHSGKTTPYSPFYWEGDEYATHFIQFEIGEGVLSIVSDRSIFDNHRIGNYDHAYLLSILMGNVHQAAILYGVNMPSVITLMFKYLPEFFYSFMLTLAIWLYSKSVRFGPVIKLHSQSRRSLREHILAASQMLWKSPNQLDLLSQLREQVTLAAATAIPNYDLASASEKFDLLAEKSEFSIAKIQEAMTRENRANEMEFIEMTRILKNLLKTIKD